MTHQPTNLRLRLWLPSLALLALGACATDDTGKLAKSTPVTPTERYAIHVSPTPQELQLAAHARGLSPAQSDALLDFVSRWSDANQGEITIKAPDHGADPAAAYRTATDTRDFLVSHGVDASVIHIVGYDAEGDAKAPVLVGFMSYEAKGPQCGQSWENLASTHANEPYAQFGCAVTANFAAQIADPADLVRPRAETSADATRRTVVLDKYRQGMTTSSQKDDQANGAVSSVAR